MAKSITAVDGAIRALDTSKTRRVVDATDLVQLDQTWRDTVFLWG